MISRVPSAHGNVTQQAFAAAWRSRWPHRFGLGLARQYAHADPVARTRAASFASRAPRFRGGVLRLLGVAPGPPDDTLTIVAVVLRSSCRSLRLHVQEDPGQVDVEHALHSASM
jgi:hypothetical protein